MPQKARSHPQPGMELPVAKPQDPTDPLRPPARARTDLYWPPLMWAGGTELAWESRDVAEHLGTLRGRDATTSTADAAYAVLGDRVSVDLLAVLVEWGTATAEQLYAIAGHPYEVADPRSWARQPLPLRRLWLAGLVERGTSLSPAAELPVTLRLRKGKELAALLRRLDAKQLAWVTGARPVAGPTRGDRHNLLATEVGLLLAEHCLDLTAVTGPTSALLHALDFSGRTPPGRAGADLALHFESGERIAIEITASANPAALKRKVRRWCDFLGDVDIEHIAVRVLWLDVADPERQTPAEVWSPLTRIVRDELGSRMPMQAARIAHRMHLARWRDWIMPAGPTDGVAWMDAFRLIGDGWDEEMMIDPWGAGRCDEPLLSIVQAANRSAGCPAVLRAAGPHS